MRGPRRAGRPGASGVSHSQSVSHGTFLVLSFYGRAGRSAAEERRPSGTAATYGMSQQVAPACFKAVRVFARGLRAEYMAAAARLLAGPLAPCRLWAKLDRWRDAIAPFMAGSGPARGRQARPWRFPQ